MTVIEFPGETILPLPPDKVLSGALGKLKEVVVVGTQEDGSLYFSSSTSDAPVNLWLLEQAKVELLTPRDEE